MHDHLTPDSEFDAALRLLDRQVIDVDGLMVCKVDDLELTRDEAGTWAVTAILAGPAALLPRFSGHLGQQLLELWRRLGVQQAGRTTPWRLDLDLVERVDHAVHLSVAREGLLRPAPADPQQERHRLDHLLGAAVHREDELLGHVLDVRVALRDGVPELRHLVVGRGRPGSLLGYDRSPHMGPAVLGRLVRWLHRHTGQVAVTDVVDWDWAGRRLTVRSPLAPLQPAGPLTPSPSA